MSGALSGHRPLVVEDDPATAEELRVLLESRGDRPRIVGTVEEALVALREETFCYFVFDQQLPTRLGAAAVIGGGERLIGAARRIDDRRLGLFHVTPIAVLTSYSSHEDFVSKMYDLGASSFMSKPLRGHFERFLEKIRVALERAKRADHADCAAHVESTPAEPDESALVSPDGGVAARIGAKNFGEIGLRVIDGHTVRITCNRRHVTATYIDLGFATRRRTPTREWELLLDICDNRGTFHWKRYGDFNAARQRVFVLRTKLKAAFGIDGDPFHKFRVVDGWRPKFRAMSDRTDGGV